MEAIETTTARIWVDEEGGLIHFKSKGVASTRETVAESMEAIVGLTGGQPLPILFDSRGWPSGDPASWVQFINTIETVCSAAAVIVDEASAPRMGNFPALLDTMVIPFQMFFEENEAREFLRSHEGD